MDIGDGTGAGGGRRAMPLGGGFHDRGGRQVIVRAVGANTMVSGAPVWFGGAAHPQDVLFGVPDPGRFVLSFRRFKRRLLS